MNDLAHILDRRGRLIAEAQAQRRTIEQGIIDCHSVLSLADRAIRWAGWLRTRPYLVVAAAVAITVLRPRRLLGWSARALALWRVGRFLFDMIRPSARNRAS